MKRNDLNNTFFMHPNLNHQFTEVNTLTSAPDWNDRNVSLKEAQKFLSVKLEKMFLFLTESLTSIWFFFSFCSLHPPPLERVYWKRIHNSHRVLEDWRNRRERLIGMVLHDVHLCKLFLQEYPAVFWPWRQISHDLVYSQVEKF